VWKHTIGPRVGVTVGLLLTMAAASSPQGRPVSSRPATEPAGAAVSNEQRLSPRALVEQADVLFQKVDSLIDRVFQARLALETVDQQGRRSVRASQAMPSLDLDASTANSNRRVLASLLSEMNELAGGQLAVQRTKDQLRSVEFQLVRLERILRRLLSSATRALHISEEEAALLVDAIRVRLDRVRATKRDAIALLARVSRTVALQDSRRQRLEEALREKQKRFAQRIAALREALLASSTSTAILAETTMGSCLVSVYSGLQLTGGQVAAFALGAGFRGFDLAVAVAVARAESGGYSKALCTDRNGTRDEGLWQINSVHGYARTCTFDPACNAQAAFRLYRGRGGSFADWVSYKTGTFLAYLPDAALAAVSTGENPFRVFEVCPVDAPRHYSDDFGAPRWAGGFHHHQGNDIMAPRGTPVRAPFSGLAEAVPNVLGGKAVTVRGRQGYVYNAHLSRYGSLGRVEAGTIIGFVGSTGDAAGGPPHDHFELHPGNAAAIDPYPYLQSAC
jgi:lysozyme-like protein/peptidase M23-like protein